MTKCLQCGACCRSLIVEADWMDARREPKLLRSPVPNRHRMTQAMLEREPDDRRVMLWDEFRKRCPFLDGENRCRIYPTRPNACVAFDPGSEQCQDVRRRMKDEA